MRRARVIAGVVLLFFIFFYVFVAGQVDDGELIRRKEKEWRS